MNNILYLVLASAEGLLLGVIFFGGLWFTVRKAMTAKIPALWIFFSFLLRIGIALVGFYFIGAGSWQRLVACLIGFVAARFAVIFYTKSTNKKSYAIKKEVIDET